MVMKYIYQHLPFKGPPKFPQIWNFWYENKPSGNPALLFLVQFAQFYRLQRVAAQDLH
jgi:hypothetical protein